MARFKIHKAGPIAIGEGGTTVEPTALCKTTHRALLPLKLTDQWQAVTCEKCAKRNPRRQHYSLWNWIVDLFRYGGEVGR